MTIQQISRREVYKNRWMTIYEDKVRREDGSEGIFGVVEKPDFVAIVATVNEGILLVQQFRYAVGARTWEIPQGSWESNTGMNFDLVAAGELREETGYEPGELRLAGRLLLASGFCSQGYKVYHARDLKWIGTARDPEEQDMLARVFSFRDLDRMVAHGEIVDATTLASLALLRAKGFLRTGEIKDGQSGANN